MTNILYFVCHDLGRALGCYGAGIPTPHLDAFASQGVRFDNAHCSTPACSPSRAAAMSGLYAHTSGAMGLSHMGWPLDIKWPTTVDDFNAAGYQTILSGINHERHPRTDRYQTDLSHNWEDWKLPTAVDNAIKALQQRDTTQPFYLNIATQEPHACMWKDVGTKLPAMPDDWPDWMPPGMPTTPALKLAFRRFAAAVVFMDEQFGKLLRELDRLKLSENTLIIFTTDHGMSGPRGKGSLYGLGTEIALLMRLPGVLPAAQTHSTGISNLGFRATFAAAAGIPLVSESQGKSFWDHTAYGSPNPPLPIFLERNFHGEKPWRTESEYVDVCDPIRAVRTNEYLYIRNFMPECKPPDHVEHAEAEGPQNWYNWETSWALPRGIRPQEELYDLKSDPLEQHNVVGDPAHEITRHKMRMQLAEWMADTRDYLPGSEPRRPEEPGWGPNWA